jgi:ribosome hibernation promoting factor
VVKEFTTTEEGFPITVIGRHVEVTEAVKQYARDKVGKMERFSHQILEATVTMDVQKLEHRVAIVLKVGHTLIKVAKASENMYASIDMAVEKLQHKLHRYRSRLKEHHATPLSAIDINVNVVAPGVETIDDINDEIMEENQRRAEEALRPHEVVNRKTQPLHTLRVDEAVMKLDLSGDHFLIFRSEEDQKLKVMYEREDGNYGIVEPE